MRAPVPARLREMVIERSEYSCDRCAKPLIGRPYSLQHRRARGRGGRKDAHTAANLIVLCGSATTGCHGRVENQERAEAYRYRFAIRGEVEIPEETPIFRHMNSWVIPGEGLWIPSVDPDQESEAA